MALPAIGEIALAGKGLVHQAHHGPAIAIEAHQRSPDRHAGDKGPRSVDRIDDPDIFALQPLRAMLLAENAVIRIMFADQRPDRLLRRPVAFGDWIETAGQLVVDIQAGAKPRQGLGGGGGGERLEEFAVGQHVMSLVRYWSALTRIARFRPARHSLMERKWIWIGETALPGRKSA